METNLPLIKLGEFVWKTRKDMKMTQIEFYRYLFPEKSLDDENIKKKMNVIENGKGKNLNYEFLFRLHERFDLSIDCLFGFETEYPNYENKAACKYTGLEPEAIRQLHFWNKYLNMDESLLENAITTDNNKILFVEKNRINEAKWIFEILNMILQPKSNEERKDGISDLSILYDIFMMVTSEIEKVVGIPMEVMGSNLSWNEKMMNNIAISPESLCFSDSMNEPHNVNIKEINRKIWEERLMNDIDDMIEHIKNDKAYPY